MMSTNHLWIWLYFTAREATKSQDRMFNLSFNFDTSLDGAVCKRSLKFSSAFSLVLYILAVASRLGLGLGLGLGLDITSVFLQAVCPVSIGV
jgi:hypothetical protein